MIKVKKIILILGLISLLLMSGCSITQRLKYSQTNYCIMHGFDKMRWEESDSGDFDFYCVHINKINQQGIKVGTLFVTDKVYRGWQACVVDCLETVPTCNCD